MEQQTKSINSSEQKQVKPVDSLRSIITSSRYWLAALPPFFVILLGFIVLLLRLDEFLSSEFDSSDLIYFGLFIRLYISLLGVFVIGAAISCSVNFFLPFATTFRRATFMSLPTLIFIISFLIFVYSDNDSNIIIWIIGFLFFGLPAPIMIMIFGWLGAQVGISRGHKA